MLNINLLFTNSYKVSLEKISKDTSIDSLKIKLFREYSDNLPIPSNVFIENEDSIDNDQSISAGTNDGDKKETQILQQDNYYSKSHSSIVHQNQIRLIFSGKQLENFSTLEDNCIENDDTILVAISPYISNFSYVSDRMAIDNSGCSSGSDTVFLGVPIKRMYDSNKVPEKPIFKLTINDRSYRQDLINQDQSKPSKLEHLNDNETFKLLNRIKSDNNNNNQDQSNINNDNKNVKLIPIIKNNNNNNFNNNNQSLETIIDRLSLHDIPVKEFYNINNDESSDTSSIGSISPTLTSLANSNLVTKKPLEIQTFTPINEVSFCDSVKVIFNRPFLPLANELEKYEIPIKIEPELAHGKWSTIDGIVFEYKCVPPEILGQQKSLFASTLNEFPLSTEFKVTIDSKRFKQLYNEDIQENTYYFKTITQSIQSTEFNKLLDNPQIRITFSQPIRFVNYFGIFVLRSEKIGGILCPKPKLSYKVLSNDDPDNYYFNKCDSSSSIIKSSKESTIVLKITSNIKQFYSFSLHLETNLGSIGSKEGPLINNSKVLSKFQTPELLSIFPEYMKGEQLSRFSYVRFNSTCNLQKFDFVGIKKEKALDKYITITPNVKINNVEVSGKIIYIYADFKPLKTYHVTLNNFQDSFLIQTSATSTGYFSFPDYPQKIYLTKDNYYSQLNNPFFDLDPSDTPSINVNTEGISKLLVKAYSVSNDSLLEQKQIGKIVQVPIIKKSIINDTTGEEEEERSTKTNIDLTSFYGISSTKLKPTHSILKFKIKSAHDSKVKLSLLLQYTPLLVNHIQLGKEVSLIVSNIHSNKLYENNELSITLYNHINNSMLPTTLDKEKKFIKSENFESSHILIESKDGFKSIYKHHISKLANDSFIDKWTIMDSSGIYRPGDVVNIKGLLRLYSDSSAQILSIPSHQYLKSNNLLSTTNKSKTKEQVEKITYKVLDGKNEILTGETLFDAEHGSFEFKFEIPLNCQKLGRYYVDLEYNETYKEKHYFDVEEFKRKQFLVESTLYTLDSGSVNDQGKIGYSETDNPFSIQVFAKSYTGEILPDTMVEWNIRIRPSFDNALSRLFSNYSFNSNESNLEVSPIKYTSKRNSNGRHHLDLVLQDSIYSSNITIEATVIDITNNRETITNSFYIKSNQIKYFGISKDIKPFVNRGDNLVLDMILCDSKGVIGTDEGKINIKIRRMPWSDDLPSELVLDHTILPEKNNSPITFNHQFNHNGHHRVSLIYIANDYYAKDQEFHFNVFSLGKQTQAELDYIVSTNSIGMSDSLILKNKFDDKLKPKPTFCNKSPINLQIKLDKLQYQLNENASLLITSKLTSANGFLFFVKDDFIIDRFTIVANGQVEFKFKVTEKYLFNTSIIVYLQGYVTTITSGIPFSRLSNDYSQVRMNVEYKPLKQLDIEFINLKKLQTPSQESEIVLNVKSHLEKKPLSNAQVTMAIVDNSILDINKHSIKNPLDNIFYKEYAYGIQSGSSLDSTMFKVIEDIVTTQEEKAKMDVISNNQNDNEFEIYVNYFSGRTIMLKVSQLTTISKVKEIIKERDGLPDYTQRLFFLNKQLDQGTIGEHSILPGSVLKLVIRLFGGGNNAEEKVIPEETAPIRLRDNFNPLAHFSTVLTDSKGNATFKYQLPDNLTLYKVMVLVSYKNDLFGVANDYFTSKLPIQIRPSPPRFLNHHDVATFPVTISNVLDFDLIFEGAFRSDNCKLLTNQGYKCKLPSNSRIVIPITCKALVPNSTSNFEFVAKTLLDFDTSQELCDAVAFKIPIKSSSTLESTTINSSLDNMESNYEFGTHQMKFDNWQKLDSEVGGLSIQLNTDPLQKVTCSLKDLMYYSYSCSEQIASKLIAFSTFIQYPSLVKVKNESNEFTKESALNSINEMILVLKKRLTKNYGFRYWDEPKSKEYEYVTMYAFWVINQVAKVSQEAKLLVNDYCQKYVTASKIFEFDETEYKKEGHHYLFGKAILLFFYGQIFDKYPNIKFVETIQSKAKQDLNPVQYHQIFIYICQFLKSDQYYSNINNYLNITGTLAHLDFNSSNSIYGFNSNVRCQAILILSLLEDNKKHSHLLTKLVAGLSHYTSRDGYFYSTQDNAFYLIAVSEYYSKNFKDLPLYTTTSIQLNNHYVENRNIVLLNPIDELQVFNESPIDETQDDRRNKKYEVFIPFKQVLKNQSNLVIEKLSKGILFYTLNLSYATLNPILKSVTNRGFSIIRKFSAVSNDNDVVYLKNNDELTPNIKIRPGSKVKVSLFIKTDANSTFVAIKDRLPAGLEPIDTKSNQFNGFWSSQINNRETGIEIFSDSLYKGCYQFNYYAIAITTGTFISPPAKIEEMYCPASYGRTQTDIVLIK